MSDGAGSCDKGWWWWRRGKEVILGVHRGPLAGLGKVKLKMVARLARRGTRTAARVWD